MHDLLHCTALWNRCGHEKRPNGGPTYHTTLNVSVCIFDDNVWCCLASIYTYHTYTCCTSVVSCRFLILWPLHLKGVDKLTDEDKSNILKIVDGCQAAGRLDTSARELMISDDEWWLSQELALPSCLCRERLNNVVDVVADLRGYSARALRVLAIAARPMSKLP